MVDGWEVVGLRKLGVRLEWRVPTRREPSCASVAVPAAAQIGSILQAAGRPHATGHVIAEGEQRHMQLAGHSLALHPALAPASAKACSQSGVTVGIPHCHSAK